MATVPLSGTNIRLMTGVPFYNDYKNSRWFDTLSAQTSYFLGKTAIYQKSDHNFQKIEGKHFIAVNKSIDDLWGVNYLMFQNTSYNSKWFYAFVTKIERVQINTTYVYFEIDVFQTWRFEMNFKPSFVAREHCKLWESDGSPVINTIDEGLNYGTEYDTVISYNVQPNGGYKWMVIVSTNAFHIQDKPSKPTVIGLPQPLTYYITPFRDDDTIPPVVLPNGSGYVGSKPSEILENIYKNADAVNAIVSIYITDWTGIPTTYDNSTEVITFPNTVEIEPYEVSTNCKLLYVKKVIDFKTFNQDLGNKWGDYNSVTESKLLMHPYTQVVLDDFKGNRVFYKNEYITDTNLKITGKGSLGHSNKTSYAIKEYNSGASSAQTQLSDEFALINSDPNDVPILTSMLAAYIQGNRNSLALQRQQIAFNGTADTILGGVGAIASGARGNIGGFVQGAGETIKGNVNSQFALEALNAKQKDIANLPSSMAKQGSNSSYTIGNNYNGVFVIKKQIKAEYRKKLSDYFKMYGYKVNEVKIPNFHTRQNWNYVQTISCNITGNFNNEDLNELKSVFDNGITLWHTDDIGNYELANGVI